MHVHGQVLCINDGTRICLFATAAELMQATSQVSNVMLCGTDAECSLRHSASSPLSSWCLRQPRISASPA
jgi:hypothetical protein